MRSSSRFVSGVLAAVSLAGSSAASTLPSIVCSNGPVTEWAPASGGNGHFYQAICGDINWTQANAAAVAAGRHLATITSAEENAFVFSLIDDQVFWKLNGTNYGPWLGGFQPPGSPEPAADWSWVTGEDFGFSGWWAATEPNNNGEEDNLLFYDGTIGAVRSAKWADLPASFTARRYVAE